MNIIIVVLVGYLIGSIPFGYLIVRLSVGADIRETGSGGTGATNVSRRAGKLAGLLTLLLDAAKGVAAVTVAKLVVPDANWIAGLVGLAALVGHVFPIWLKFRGGKGVATGLGVMAALVPVVTAISVATFLTVFLLTRFVSLSSIIAAMVLPIVFLAERLINGQRIDWRLFVTLFAGAALIVWAHRTNIARLRAGTETKFR